MPDLRNIAYRLALILDGAATAAALAVDKAPRDEVEARRCLQYAKTAAQEALSVLAEIETQEAPHG